MRCIVSRENLVEPLTHLERTVGKHATLPVLSCILLNVDGDILSMSTTNLEVGIRCDIPVRDAEPGTAAVAASVFAHVVNTLPVGATLTMVLAAGHLEITSAGATSRIALHDTAEFPVLPKVEGGTTVRVPARDVREAIASVAYCASTSTIKPELASVFVHLCGSELVTAATDSFRLAERRLPLKRPVSAEPFLIPARSSVDLVRMLERVEGGVDVELVFDQHQLSLTQPGRYLTMRLVAGTFPDYTQIIPREFVTEATLLTSDLARVLRKASVFSNEFNQTTLTLSPKKKTCTIHTRNVSVGESTDTVPATLTGEELTISFNQRYLVDALHTIASDSVTVRFAGQGKPALVRPVGDETFLYLVMPMNR